MFNNHVWEFKIAKKFVVFGIYSRISSTEDQEQRYVPIAFTILDGLSIGVVRDQYRWYVNSVITLKWR